MIKILHTADIHLGKEFSFLRERGREYRYQLLRTFEKIVDLAGTENASLFLIAGDLFDSNRVYGLTVSRVLSAFEKLEKSGVRVCIVPGTHDAYSENSLYRSLHFPPNVVVFTPERNQMTYEDLDITVYGMVPESESWEKGPLQSLSLTQKSKFHIGIAHCPFGSPEIGENGAMLLDKDEIGNSGLDYLALGEWHSFQDLSYGTTRACYCGSPELIDMDQKGAGNVVMVTIHEKNNVEIQPVRIGTKKCESITIDVSPFESVDSIVKTIEARSDPNLLLDITLTGLSGMDYDLRSQEIESMLDGHFFNLRVFDRSRLKIEKTQNYPEKTVMGRFLRIIENKIDSASTQEDKSLYEEALKLGFSLLQGRLQIIE